MEPLLVMAAEVRALPGRLKKTVEPLRPSAWVPGRGTWMKLGSVSVTSRLLAGPMVTEWIDVEVIRPPRPPKLATPRIGSGVPRSCAETPEPVGLPRPR